MISPEKAHEILMEVTRGIYINENDTLDEHYFRDELVFDIVEIKAVGGIVDIPPENA